MITYQEMMPGFKQLAAAYRVELNEPQLVLYARYVGALGSDVEEWEVWIVQQTILTCKFWPSIAELVQVHRDYRRRGGLGVTGGSVKLAGATEWIVATGDCWSVASPVSGRRVDRRKLIAALTPLGLEAAILAEVPGMQSKDIHAGTRKRFLELYEALDKQGELAPVRRLKPASEAVAP